jgi:hypothetical protein
MAAGSHGAGSRFDSELPNRYLDRIVPFLGANHSLEAGYDDRYSIIVRPKHEGADEVSRGAFEVYLNSQGIIPTRRQSYWQVLSRNAGASGRAADDMDWPIRLVYEMDGDYTALAGAADSEIGHLRIDYHFFMS